MGLTRTELQNQWKQSTTNKRFKEALVSQGPRRAFGTFIEFVRDVRNDYRPDLKELLAEWQITQSALRSNIKYYDIKIEGISDRLSRWIRLCYDAGMSRDWCMRNFRVGASTITSILGEHQKQEIALSRDQVKQYFIQKLTIKQIADMHKVSIFRLQKYLKDNEIEYSFELLKSDITNMCKEGKRVSEIKTIFNTTSNTIIKYMSLWGIEYSPQHIASFAKQDEERRVIASKKGAEKSKTTSIERMDSFGSLIIPLYEQGMSIKQIGIQLQISQGFADKTLKHHGFDVVSKQEYLDNLSRQSMEKWLSCPREGYDYSLVTFEDWKSGQIPIICNTHGTFVQNWSNHFSLGAGCPKCSLVGPSKGEQEVYDYVLSLGVPAEQSNRTLLKGKELDILVPDHNIAIEYNGIYWHSSADIKDLRKYYHLSKTEECERLGIQLLHIMSNEWEDPIKRDIWKSIIRAKINKIDNRIYARNTSISSISSKDANIFLENNHMQGPIRGNNIALLHGGEVVALLVYGKSRFEKNSTEILRMCSKCNMSIIGGMSKMIKSLRCQVDGSVVSYANRRWSNGNVYDKCGFIQSHITGPNYCYVSSGNALLSRYQCQKHKLNKLLEDKFDASLTEKENMLNAGYRILFDSGNIKYYHK